MRCRIAAIGGRLLRFLLLRKRSLPPGSEYWWKGKPGRSRLLLVAISEDAGILFFVSRVDGPRLERTMTSMIKACDGGAVPECPIIDALFNAPAVVPS